MFLDLTLARVVNLVKETLRCDPSIALVSLSPPSGSLSRARENPVRGGGGYPPLRSTARPQGLPNLKADDRVRVLKSLQRARPWEWNGLFSTRGSHPYVL